MQEDWIEVELGIVCQINMGQSPPSSTYNTVQNGLPFFQGKAEFTELHPSPVKWCTEPKKIAEKGNILLSVRAPVGSTNIASERCGIGRGLAAISFKYSNTYLWYYLKGIEKKLDSQGTGTTFKAISGSILKSQIFPLAPLPIQRAIVTKIENLFASLDKGITDLKKAQEQLKIYRQAVLKKAFEGELTKEWREANPYNLNDFLEQLIKEKEDAVKNKLIGKSEYFPKYSTGDVIYQYPNNWICLPWKTLTSNNKYAMKRGPFGSALKKSFFVDKGFVVYEQGHAINDDPYRHRYYITPEKFEEMKAFEVKGGDMIISCSGVTLGRICLLPEDADTGVINQALLKIDMDERVMFKKYFIMLFRSETFQRLIFGKSLGTAMPNMVGMTELKEIPIPVPSISEQKQIIKEIESRLSVCDKVEQNISEALNKSEALRQSILKKAFEGKLLSEAEIEKCKQEADYEPASVLLERIKLKEV